MNWNLVYLAVVACAIPDPLRCCECGEASPACAYLGADVIFLGRVSFTNDDGSGKFTQATLVRFDVDERFKGVAPSVRQIWVDPGSFTSCYQGYELGERYLMFATLMAHLPSDTAAMTVFHDSSGKKKPIPPGFDTASPTTVYYAPECAGSRTDRFPGLDRDLAMLRAYRAGAIPPRVLGHVYLYPFIGWPFLTGPVLQGAQITLGSGAVVRRTITNGKGDFSLEDVPTGFYSVLAELPPFRMAEHAILQVPDVGCGYTDIQLSTTSTLQGVVLDHRGRPAKGIPVTVWPKDAALAKAMRLPGGTTDASGRFSIGGLPDLDLYLSAGSDHPTVDMPYRLVYYPSGFSPEHATVLRLKPGEHRQEMVLCLEAPLERANVRVRVVNRQDQPAKKASVQAFEHSKLLASFRSSQKLTPTGLRRFRVFAG